MWVERALLYLLRWRCCGQFGSALWGWSVYFLQLGLPAAPSSSFNPELPGVFAVHGSAMTKMTSFTSLHLMYFLVSSLFRSVYYSLKAGTSSPRFCPFLLSFGWTNLCFSLARLITNMSVLLVNNPPEIFRSTRSVGDDQVIALFD